MLQSDQTSCMFFTLDTFGVSGLTTTRLACHRGRHGILKYHGVTPHHICENLRLLCRPIGELFTVQVILRAIMPLAVMQIEHVSKMRAHFFLGGDTKIYRVSYYELSPSACVQDLGSIGHSRDLELFPKSRWPQWKHSIIAYRGKYKQMVANSFKSLTSQVTVTFNANKHL